MEADRRIFVNRKKKSTTKAELESFSREELIARVLQLQAHNSQLLNIMRKEREKHAAELAANLTMATTTTTTTTTTATSPLSSAVVAENSRNEWEKNGQQKFDFSTCKKRHIFLKFYYLGWSYQGFTIQEHTNNTIEHHLFEALRKVCLIEQRETSNYHRCGRTDRGVSAFSQVISIDVRSKFDADVQMNAESIKNEINYCEVLNRVLPSNIKCVAWAPVSSVTFSARFDCKLRTYRYFFPRSNLNVDAMNLACKLLQGHHDFRNFCKMDVANGVVTFMRDIRCASIQESTLSAVHSSYDMLYLEIIGSSYLWHQIRCIMAILMLIGEEKECPDIITTLLDVDNTPCTPQYSMASDVALNLYNVQYKERSDYANDEEYEKIEWVHDELNLNRVITSLQSHWTTSSVQTTMIMEMLKDLHKIYENELNGDKIMSQLRPLLEGVQPRQYQPLMSRTTCSSLENRIEHYAKKRRIEIQTTKGNDDEMAVS